MHDGWERVVGLGSQSLVVGRWQKHKNVVGSRSSVVGRWLLVVGKSKTTSHMHKPCGDGRPRKPALSAVEGFMPSAQARLVVSGHEFTRAE
jgi:hypothetical protein